MLVGLPGDGASSVGRTVERVSISFWLHRHPAVTRSAFRLPQGAPEPWGAMEGGLPSAPVPALESSDLDAESSRHSHGREARGVS
jgi:hypothetical protein